MRGRVIVGFGPGRSEGVLFRNVIFLDNAPMIEVVLLEEGGNFVVKKRLVV
jgi:hypothetical protein